MKKCGQVPVVQSSEKTPTHKIHDSVPSKHQRMSVLDQGKFGLRSEFALATCAAHSLQCKYGLLLSDETLLDKWHNNSIPPKAMWPDECAGFIGEFRHQWPTAIHSISLILHPAGNWKHFCDMVHAFAGFRCAVVVASIGPPEDRSNHSMSAIHWNQCDGNLVCQNSWGCNLSPFVEIHSSDFVRGWVVEVVISRQAAKNWTTPGEAGVATITCVCSPSVELRRHAALKTHYCKRLPKCFQSNIQPSVHMKNCHKTSSFPKFQKYLER